MQRTEDKGGAGYVIAQLGLLGALASLLLPWLSVTLPGAQAVTGRGFDIARGVTGPGVALAPSMKQKWFHTFGFWTTRPFNYTCIGNGAVQRPI